MGIFTVGVPAAITCFTTEVISESSPLAISASPSAASRGSATAMASNAAKTITNFNVLDFGIELNRALFLRWDFIERFFYAEKIALIVVVQSIYNSNLYTSDC